MQSKAKKAMLVLIILFLFNNTPKNIQIKPDYTSFGSRTTPWLTEKAVAFLCNFLEEKPDAKILEFGCGGSTIWFSKYTKNLITIEHSPDWHQKINNYINETKECNKTDLRLLQRPYYTVCLEFPEEYFDLILVDGRDRVRCVEAAMHILKRGGILMLDNAEKSPYKIVNNLLKDWTSFKTKQEKPDIYNFCYQDWQTNWWIKP